MTTNLKRHVYFLPMMLIALITACQVDKIEVPDKELYTREFVKQFGVFDTSSGWNSSRRVTANIDPSVLAGGSSVKVYTAWPTSHDCRIVASYPADKTTFTFDYPVDLKYVYVQVTDVNGKPLYGDYSEVVDGILNVGNGSRAGESAAVPTVYDLTNNPALGYFLVDEEYEMNHEFWQSWTEMNLYTPKEYEKPDPVPDNIDKNEVFEVWAGTHSLDSNWDGGDALVVQNSAGTFSSAKSNHLSMTVEFSTQADDAHCQIFANAPGGWKGPLANYGVRDKTSVTVELHRNDVSDLKQYDLVVAGIDITITKVTFKQLDYEGISAIDPDKIDTETMYDITGLNPDENISGKEYQLSGFDKITSNQAEITLKFEALSSYPQIEIKDWDRILYYSGKNTPGEERTVTLTADENMCERLVSGGIKLTGKDVKVKEIKLRNLSYLKKSIGGGKAPFSKLFKLYGLVEPGQSVNNMDEFIAKALAPQYVYSGKGYAAKDIVSLVGRKKGVFHEEVDDNGECNLRRFFDELQPAEGVHYETSAETEVSLDYVFGCASTFNSFGYFYFTDEEAKMYMTDRHYDFIKTLLRKPKFLLIYKALPHTNVLIKDVPGQENWREPTDLRKLFAAGGVVSSHGQDEGKDQSDGWDHCTEFSTMVEKAENGDYDNAAYEYGQYPRFRPANYKLVYFAPDQFESDGVTLKPGAQGSYKFPAHTHIAFFVINGGQYALQRNGKAGFTLDYDRISFSRPYLNRVLGNVFDIKGHSHIPGSPSTNIAGRTGAIHRWTPFVTYQWGGQILMGVEDYFARTHDGINGGDHDMNDLIFRVNGSFVRERKEMSPDTPKKASWIIGCEDLGGTFDFDFNDVVFGVTHVAGETTADITALASGGTLPVYVESKYPQAGVDSQTESPANDGYYVLKPNGSNDGEFHSWWGSDKPYTAPINVSGWGNPGATVKITVPEDYSISSNISTPGVPVEGAVDMGGLRVRVHRNDKDYNIISAPTQNQEAAGYEAPQMFLVPYSWRWPIEHQNIQQVYTQFNPWTDGWWNTPDGEFKDNIILHNWSPKVTLDY